ncbi:MAG: NF038122 family metalloprotease [Acidiferrobacteraceae bacterium]
MFNTQNFSGSSLQTSRRRFRIATAVAVGLMVLAPSAQALTFNVTYDSSVNSAPAGFKSAFQDSISFYQQTFSNPITIDLSVGWGEVGGTALSSGTLGESESSLVTHNYSTVRTALANNGSPGYLPASNPTGGRSISMTTAEAEALNLSTGTRPGSLNGAVGFSSSSQWTFSSSNRAVSNQYDFIGTAEHEISEVMGRFSGLNPTCTAGSTCPESVQDLFRYTSPGTLDLVGSNAYFSIDGGKSKINTFNGSTSAGDLGDWAGKTTDSYNYAFTTGTEYPVTAGDITMMNALGYTLAAPVPEPNISTLLATALLMLIPVVRIRRKAARA